MLTVLFWNLNGRDRAQACARLAHRHGVSVLYLAECVRPQPVLRALNPAGQPAGYYYLRSRESRITTFSTFEAPELPIEVETRHYAVRRLVLSGVDELLLVCVHLPSRLWQAEDEQERILRQLAQRLVESEHRRGHGRTLLIGDLNAHPFQRGVFSADGLHGVPTRSIAARGIRVVGGERYPMLYNPMWRFFGDTGPGPPGTYYRWRAEHDCLFWYMFDQVLLRPALLQYLADSDLEILTTDGVDSFLRPDGTPDPDTASDHLPVLIRLNYPGV
jgi:hypothetical protein